MGKFEIREKFYVNEESIQIISGAIHYFRVVPEYWRDRLEKLKAGGCNTVETYVPWNMHEAKKGEFNFEGMYDLGKFIKTAQEVGLLVIVRPSPYICAEFEFGGLPYWLLKDKNLRVREFDKAYLGHVKDYYKELFKVLTPLQINYGGPIIMMQIENEYGSYGNDKRYLNAIKDMMIDCGTVVPLFTSDGPTKTMLDSGTVEGVLPTANFGGRSLEAFEFLKQYTGEKPLMCMEFWLAWFDAWGVEHHTRDANDVAENIDKMLEVDGNVNIYMYHGGTNWGFTNGANKFENLTVDTASYDYDAPISECGDLSEKYYAIKDVISKYREIPEVEFSTEIKKIAYGEVKVSEKVSLFNCLDEISTPHNTNSPVSMEDLDQGYGYVLYRSNIGDEQEVSVCLRGASDRAQVFINNDIKFTQFDTELGKAVDGIKLDKKDDNIIDILVENMGRVNYGALLNHQRKGITDGVTFNNTFHFGWEQYSLPLDNLDKLTYTQGYEEKTPSFFKFNLEVNEKGDTFLNMDGWGKGCVFLNGFNLGRFWNIGPQKSLYIPAPLLKEGANEIIIFETEGKSKDTIVFENVPNLG